MQRSSLAAIRPSRSRPEVMPLDPNAASNAGLWNNPGPGEHNPDGSGTDPCCYRFTVPISRLLQGPQS